MVIPIIRVLFLCTGNSARSQMAEAILRHLGEQRFEVYSAGTAEASQVNPFALEVLREMNIDTSMLYPKNVKMFLGQRFDLVITVCDNARQTCPFFPGARQQWHWSLEDPASFHGTYFEMIEKFREIRDKIIRRIENEVLPLSG